METNKMHRANNKCDAFSYRAPDRSRTVRGDLVSLGAVGLA